MICYSMHLSECSILNLLTAKGLKIELKLGFRAVVMIVGVNGGGKTTSLGKLANRFKNEGTKVLLAAGDTYRAAASDQLEIWAQRTGCEIVVAGNENAKVATVLSQAVKRGKLEGYDLVLCDTSGPLWKSWLLARKLLEKLLPVHPMLARTLPADSFLVYVILELL
ncbi:cell division protein FtsY, chloroplastic [Salvia divinorum]|uniref:Cell division protein FtsY, chloroplastic n=1 Tax=Salvia divinorum TaxID=28513 RepID=A0ABD1G7Q1_SALDI